MKTKVFLLLAILAGLFTITSCTEDETALEPVVTLSVQNTGVELDFVTGAASQNVSFSVLVQADGKLKDFQVIQKKMNDGSITNTLDLSPAANVFEGKTDYTFAFNFDYVAADFAGLDSIYYEFIAIDELDQVGDAGYRISMKVYTRLTTEVTTGKIYSIMGAGKACWDLKNDAAVSAVGDLSATRYMINSNTTGAPVGSPSTFDGSWKSDQVVWAGTSGDVTTAGNSTDFVKANTYNYDNAYKETALTAFNSGVASKTVTAPVVNDIYIAKLGTEIYVIKITKVDNTTVPTTKENTGVLEFSYKK